MGLSIHYRGAIRDYAMIDQLITEVRDIALSLNWAFHEFDDRNLKGIYIAPEECEPAFLTFLRNGRLCSPVNFQLWQPNDPYYYTISVKTQFAGMDAHMALLKLLHYLSKNYFSVFDLEDEGLYWGTFDEAVLKEQFRRYDAAMNAIETALTNFEAIPGESAESLAGRLEKWFKKNMKKDE